jgi:hypothetical protein
LIPAFRRADGPGSDKPYSRLTEVHVPAKNKNSLTCQKWAFGVGFRRNAAVFFEMSARCKYQSKWYGNRLALTIYVNANELHFSPNITQPFAPLACTTVQASFNPRG